MDTFTDRHTGHRFAVVSRVAASVCMAAAAIVIAGWYFRVDALTRIPRDPNFVAPNTAVTFFLCSAAVLLLHVRDKWGHLASRVLATLTGIFAILTVLEYLLGTDFGIDALVFHDKISNWTITSTPGRYALQTAIAFTCASIALLLTDVEWRNLKPSEAFASVVLLVAFFGLLGYFYGASALHGVMSFSTSLLFAVFSTSLLFLRPTTGLMALVAGESSAGLVARRLITTTAIVLPLLGWFQVQVGARKWMDREPRNALFAAAGVLAMSLVVLSAARAIEVQEKRRREGEERFRSLSASSPVGIFLADPHGRSLYANQRCAAICGYSESDSSGENWIQYVYAGDRERVQKTWQAAVAQHRDWQEEVRFGMNDRSLRWTVCRGAPILSETGELIGYAGTVEDVTDRKLAEMTIRKTEKLAAMGRLAGTIAHEINNPLEALSNLFYLLQMHPSLDGTAREYANMADQQLSRISTITKQSLAFYRESKQATTVAVSEILGEVLDFYRELANAQKITVDRNFDTQGMIIAHAGELRQVFANVIGNAVQAMPHGGTLRVHLFPASQRATGERNGIRVNVVDTGAGIPREVSDRLFEPFFTTKAEKGTGLGLWVSRGILEKYEGSIRFRSARWPASSTCFSIFLPTVIHQTRRLAEKELSPERVSAQKA